MRTPRTVVAGALLALAAGAGAASAQMRTAGWSRAATSEEALEVQVTYGAGELSVMRAEAGELYRARLAYDEEHFDPRHSYSDGRLLIGVRGLRGRGLDNLSTPSAAFDLWLSPDVPTDLSLHFGAGVAEVDLTGVPLSGLEINTGASDTDVRLDEPNPARMRRAEISAGAAQLKVSGLGNLKAEHVAVQAGLGAVELELDGAWPDGAEVEIEMGLGSLRMVIPESLGVELNRRNFLASLDAEGFERDGRTHRSLNWDRADKRIEIDVSASLGSIEVVWMPL